MAYLQAAIFDMDGVVLDTAKLHYFAWKSMFDAFLKDYYAAQKQHFIAFCPQDYLYYVDGISRYEGVRCFLASRHIPLPMGSAEDEATYDSLYGLAKRKNQLFHELLSKQEVEIFPSSIHFIESLRAQGVKTAITSASKNCKNLLARAGISGLFDAIVDGELLEQKQLPSKPAPDIFLEAMHLLQVSPENVMVVEDALLGVQAGRAAQCGLVVGVDRKGMGIQIFKEQGADLVVTDLNDLIFEGLKHWFSYQLVQVFDQQGKLNRELAAKLSGKQLVLFLDYDGTLTPIVDRPDLAKLDTKIRTCLQYLSQQYMLAIISGRELSDVQSKVNLPGLYYAGNHGMEIAGPHLQHTEGREYLKEIEEVYQFLVAQLGKIPGILIENKKFSLSVHFRLVADTELGIIQEVIRVALQDHPQLIRHEGKKIFEIRPKINWHKGNAVLWLLDALQLKQFNILPIYIGDDVTDEDAFRTVRPLGVSIVVSRRKQTTKAQYCLKNTVEVEKFLTMLLRGVYA